VPDAVPQLDRRDDGAGGPTRELTPARQRLLDVAAEMFRSRGYDRTPLRAISASLGVTKAAIYYHFKAKEDLLVAIVEPMLDRIDGVIDAAGPAPLTAPRRRAFLAGYVNELVAHSGVIALLQDPAVGEHALGLRFAGQHERMRQLLGPVDEPASLIRATIALRAVEVAIAEFGDTDHVQLRATALHIAVAVVDVQPRTRAAR
jgi:AcrR family transcriptional regulator